MIDVAYYMTWSINADTSRQNCWTFVCKVLSENFNVELPRLRRTGRRHEEHAEVIRQQQLSGDWAEVPSPSAGCLVLFMLGGNRPHVGILLDERRFLHFSETDRTVKVDRLNAVQWRNRVDGFYKHRSN